MRDLFDKPMCAQTFDDQRHLVGFFIEHLAQVAVFKAADIELSGNQCLE